MVARLSKDEHDAVVAAVTAAEAQTDGEIVTIVARQSDDYREVPFIGAGLAAAAVLAAAASAPAWFEQRLIDAAGGWHPGFTAGEELAALLVLTSLASLITALALRWSWLRLAVVPRPIRNARVRARAIELFRVGTERRTVGLTGILIYLSMAEHRAEIVADEAIASKVEPSVWGDAMADLIAEARQGRPGLGMAAAARDVGVVLKQHFPKSQGNPNELPDRLIEL